MTRLSKTRRIHTKTNSAPQTSRLETPSTAETHALTQYVPLDRSSRRRMSSGFWKPGTSGPGGLDRGEDDTAQLVNPKRSNLPLSAQRQSLPIYRHRNSLLFALQKYRATVLVGETGSGKTTQVSLSYVIRRARYDAPHGPHRITAVAPTKLLLVVHTPANPLIAERLLPAWCILSVRYEPWLPSRVALFC